MTFLPIVERELRAASRRRSTYWGRVLAALVGLLFAGWKLFAMAQLPPAEQGRQLFYLLSTLAFFYCLLIGVHLTADCVSTEKREGTLGFLFLTDLKGYDVAFGKLAASSLGAIYGVVAILPVLAMSLILGGVTAEECGRMALVLLNTLFLSLSAGVFVSSLCEHERKAMSGTFFLLLMVCLGPSFLAMLLYNFGIRPNVGFGILTFSAFFSPLYPFLFLRMGAPGSFLGNASFWLALLLTHLVGWLLLLRAGALLQRAWQDRPQGARRLRWQALWRQWSYGKASEQKEFRSRLLDRNPFSWLAGRNRLKPASVWLFLGSMAALWYWDYSQVGKSMFEPDIMAWVFIIVHSILKVWFATEASSQLVEDQRSGTLELLLTSPLKARQIIDGQWLALKRQFLTPIIVILALDVVLLIQAFWMTNLTDYGWFKTRPVACIAFLGAVVMLVLDLYALGWVGMWQGLVAKNINRALAASVLRIFVLPWLVCVGLWLIGQRRAVYIFGQSDPAVEDAVITWLVFGVATSLIFGLHARDKLHTEFRQVASERFQPKKLWQLWKTDSTLKARDT